jgi:hypothetical protein
MLRREISRSEHSSNLLDQFEFMNPFDGTLNLIPMPLMTDEPIKCDKCGKVLVVRE